MDAIMGNTELEGILKQFQEIIGDIEDTDAAIATLESVDWDIQRAIDARLSTSTQDMAVETIDDDIGRVEAASKARETAHSPWKLLIDDDIVPSSSHNKEITNDSVGSAYADYRKSKECPLMNGIKKENQHNYDLVEVSDEEADDNQDFYDADEIVVDQEEKLPRNEDQVPLIPTDFTSVEEGLQNFQAVFEVRYGPRAPNFMLCSLDQAIRDAFDTNGRSIAERKPLLIYLHDDNAVAGHLFAQNVLSSEPVSSLVRNQFLTWAWDMSQNENRCKLFGWLKVLNAPEMTDSIQSVSKETYPLLIVVVREKLALIPVQIITGSEGSSDVLGKLMHGLDFYQNIKAQDMDEERQRMEREQMRQEQKAEYEKALEEDRAKQMEMERKARQEKIEQERLETEAKEKAEHQASLMGSLPAEPDDTASDVVIVRVRFPSGEQTTRKFRNTENIQNLITFAAAKGYPTDSYLLWTSDRPRKDVSLMNRTESFASQNWPLREQITVEEM